MIDGLNDILSHDHASPTDTNPKNLDLASSQPVTDTRLDQLVYNPNCPTARNRNGWMKLRELLSFMASRTPRWR